MTSNPQIARTIVSQLGNLTLAMLGAHMLVDLGDGVQFRVKGSRAANHVAIRYDAGADLYNVEVKRIGRAPNYAIRDVADYQGVGVEQLHELLEDATGLCTRM
jgi:hypothetical protein